MTAESLLRLLRGTVKKAVGDQSAVAIAYSGGIDSSIVAAIASEFAEVTCYTCAVRESFDAVNAVRRGEEEGLKTRLLDLGIDGLVGAVKVAGEVLESSAATPIAYSIPIIVVVKESREGLVFAGSGADELFGGYSKYLNSSDPESAMSADLGKMSTESMRIRDWSLRIGKRLEMPFISEDVVDYSKTLPLVEKIDGKDRKIVLRKVASLLDLPSYDRPKKAAQYSSGVLSLMKRAARENGVSLADWTRELVSSSRRSH